MKENHTLPPLQSEIESHRIIDNLSAVALEIPLGVKKKGRNWFLISSSTFIFVWNVAMLFVIGVACLMVPYYVSFDLYPGLIVS